MTDWAVDGDLRFRCWPAGGEECRSAVGLANFDPMLQATCRHAGEMTPDDLISAGGHDAAARSLRAVSGVMPPSPA